MDRVLWALIRRFAATPAGARSALTASLHPAFPKRSARTVTLRRVELDSAHRHFFTHRVERRLYGVVVATHRFSSPDSAPVTPGVWAGRKQWHPVGRDVGDVENDLPT